MAKKKRNQDENNNENEDSDEEQNEEDILTLYVRAGCDNRKYGACPFCQRIFMLLMLKSAQKGKKMSKSQKKAAENSRLDRK